MLIWFLSGITITGDDFILYYVSRHSSVVVETLMFTLWWSELDNQVHNFDESPFFLELQD